MEQDLRARVVGLVCGLDGIVGMVRRVVEISAEMREQRIVRIGISMA